MEVRILRGKGTLGRVSFIVNIITGCSRRDWRSSGLEAGDIRQDSLFANFTTDPALWLMVQNLKPKEAFLAHSANSDFALLPVQ
jgi:hypothetical protein